ncbi:MAG: ATP-binding protein [Candidatus Hydrogenedentes bacterium]|nr:ATP-binding protein [Candidatus Hydrogenedentota bacterium]
MNIEDEEKLLRSAALQNANSILQARLRAEEDLLQANVELERKTKELDHSLAMVRATLESTTDAILVTNRDWKVTGYNQNYIQMWGFRAEELESISHTALLESITERLGLPEHHKVKLNSIHATLPEETYDLMELTDGRTIERYSRIQYVNGQNVGRVWCFTDITARKQAEDALHRVNSTLEGRVTERTIELSKTVDRLKEEIRNREQLENRLRERTIQVQRLAGELTLAEQREREKLALTLHDTLQQLLVAAKLRAEMLRGASGEPIAELAEEVRGLISECIGISRTLTGEISPPILRKGGLIPALEWLCRWMKEKHKLDVSLSVNGQISMYREDLTILLFQSVRELLFNVVKHSGVDTAKIDVGQHGNEIRIMVSDEGIGFDVSTTPALKPTDQTGGLGLFTTQERLHLLGGYSELDSAPDQGFRFTLVAPTAAPFSAASEETRSSN